MKKLVLNVAVLSAFGLTAAVTPVIDGSTMTVTVESGADTLASAIPSTVTKFVKLGAGKLTLTTAAAWAAGAGEVEVRAGTLVLGAYANMGEPSKVTVSDGATLDFTGLAKNLFASSYKSTQFYAAGNGCGGAGALRYVSNGTNHALLKLLTLTGDTKVVGWTYTNEVGSVQGVDSGQGWGIGQYNSPVKTPTFDMGGHTLTIEGSFCLGNSSAAANAIVSNPGNIVLADTARLMLASLCYLTVNGTGAATWPAANGKTITMGNNAKMFIYMVRNAPTFTWKIVVPKDVWASYYLCNNSDGDKRGNIYTPFEVNGTLSVRHILADKTYPLHFLAPVTGSGCFHTYYREGATTATVVDTRVESTNAFQVGTLLAERGALTFQDAGTVSVTNLYANSGTLYGQAAARVGGWYADADIARLNLRGNTHFGGGDGSCSDYALMVGIDKFGILDVSDGATVSNMIYVARANGDYGAVYLSGETSELWWPSTENNRSLIGDLGYGCVMMSGGKATLPGKTVLLGRNGGSGYWFQSGGVTRVPDDYFWLGRPNGSAISTADLHVQGGTFEAEKGIRLLLPNMGHEWKGCRSVLTVGGGTAPALLTTTEILAYSTTNLEGSVELINVNSNGTLAANQIYRVHSPNTSKITWETGDWSPTHLYLNFNGGTLKFRSTQNEFFLEASRVPASTVVYAGGATFDTDGHDVGFSAALLKPTGKGIASIALPADDKMGPSTNPEGNSFLGTTRIVGYGASETISGLSDVDLSTRRAEDVILSCPGNNLPDAAVVYLLTRLRNSAACTLTLAELPTTGGLTKKGAGTLTLRGANTYGGVTRVEAGTLAFAHANGYPGGDLEIPAAALATNGVAFVTAESFALADGKKIRITGVDPATFDPKAFGRRKVLVSSATALPATLPAALEMTDAAGAPVSTDSWRLARSADGKTLTFGANLGLTVIVR